MSSDPPGLPKRSWLKAGCTHPPARQGFVWVAGGLSLRADTDAPNVCGRQPTLGMKR